MENNDLTAYIDAFFEGNLSEEEKASFVTKRETDPVFDLEVKAHQKLKETVQKQELKHQLMQFEEQFIPDKTSLIDGYLEQSLSDELLAYVENKLREDEGFQEEIEAQKFIIASIKRNALQKRLQHFEEENTSIPEEEKKEAVKEVKFIPFTPKTISLAASVVIIVFISIFFLSNPDQEAEVISSYKVQVEQKNEGLGFAGDEQQDIIIEVIEDGKHSFHYKMNKEKLQIYVEQGRNIGNVSVVYDATSSPAYMILINGKQYYIALSDKVIPLP
ncbi:hypothetical protein [Flammeovirga sp. SJP92]|uniref:hypothetical protein n=1 Tax=Flammeovirga sp. SJP92 TaxID=1775430 RepID=UPI000788B8D7|nr:hypothetical protein [Flammeovirga sp. SJP92]KXX70093.1 hypothetical protein AVL50_14570 [Flammeovirga sp. SJP92]